MPSAWPPILVSMFSYSPLNWSSHSTDTETRDYVTHFRRPEVQHDRVPDQASINACWQNEQYLAMLLTSPHDMIHWVWSESVSKPWTKSTRPAESPVLQYLSQIHPIHLPLFCDPNPSHHLSPRSEVVFLDPLFLPSPSEPCNHMIFLKHKSDYHGAAMASHSASDQAQLPTTDCKAFHSAAPLYLFLISNTILFFPLF